MDLNLLSVGDMVLFRCGGRAPVTEIKVKYVMVDEVYPYNKSDEGIYGLKPSAFDIVGFEKRGDK